MHQTLTALTLLAGFGFAQPPGPFTYLYDTGTAAPASIASRSSWTLIPEDTTQHDFAGHAVFMNDKIAVILRTRGSGAEIHAATAGGFAKRAIVTPRAGATDEPVRLSRLTIAENSPAAVQIDAVFTARSGTSSHATFRLTTGDRSLEIRPGEHTRRCSITSNAHFTVVPDFFADDFVIRPAAVHGRPVGLPTENFFLNLTGSGDAILMCVWQNGRHNADVLPDRNGYEIESSQDSKLWIACLEHPGIWHESTEVPPDWQPPFPAAWRATMLADGRLGFSVPIGEETTLPHPDTETILVYPIDRDRSTPLTVFCPIDVIRNTLGVGPCQYILQAEGLNADAPFTPAAVTQWVERQFKRKRATRSAGQIEERLTAMVEHISHTQTRITDYARFAEELGKLSATHRVLRDLESRIARQRAALKQTEYVARLARDMVACIGAENALQRCQDLGARLRILGSAQDTVLSAYRMAARRIMQACRHASPPVPQLRTRVEAMLHPSRKEK